MDLTEGVIPRAVDRAWPAVIRAGGESKPALHDHGLVGHDARVAGARAVGLSARRCVAPACLRDAATLSAARCTGA